MVKSPFKRHEGEAVIQQHAVSVSVSSQDGIVVLGKAHIRPARSLSSLPKVALQTVSMFVWLSTDRSRPWTVECRPLPFSTPLSFGRSMLWGSGLSVFREFLKPLLTCAMLDSLSARSFHSLDSFRDQHRPANRLFKPLLPSFFFFTALTQIIDTVPGNGNEIPEEAARCILPALKCTHQRVRAGQC